MANIKKREYSTTMHTKLILLSLLSTVIIFTVNIFMYVNINKMIMKIDKVYVSNASLNDLQSTLNEVQQNVTAYLDTKSSDSMEAYYISEQAYANLIHELNDKVTGDESAIMEKNIKGLSESYLELTNKTVEAKRGRNVEKYKVLFEETAQLYSILNTNIYSLNNLQFISNSANYEVLLSSLKYVEVMSVVIVIVVGILNVVLILIFAASITRPLEQLAANANLVAEGNLEVELIKITSQDEIGMLTRAFNIMMCNLKDNIEKIKLNMETESRLEAKSLMMEAHLKDARLKYLQAQINPHFLFNTLNAGAQLAMMEGAEKTYAYTQNVADFFRYNISNNKEIVSLAQEIQLADNYMYILNVRFSGEIKYVKRVDETLTHIQIPIMTLQPIVENCMNHGLRGIEWEKLIELAVYREGETICVSIRDNGVGMQQDKIEEIMNSQTTISNGEEGSNGIGMANVLSRLRLFYNRHNVIEITSAGTNMGTEVCIKLC